MQFGTGLVILSGWIATMSVATFGLFGFDKWQAGRNGGRVAEATLAGWSALGGWPGGLLGLLLFRHKSAKTSFHLKFALAAIVWLGWMGATLYLGIAR